MPKRVQMTRQRPWRHEHPDAVIVARPSKWGNPFRASKRTKLEATDGLQTLTVAVRPRDVEHAVALYRQYLTDGLFAVFGQLRAAVADDLHELAGRDLACWCPLDQPCHGDVLLEIANGGA